MTKLSIHNIRLDGGTQPRATLVDERVAEYAEFFRAGAVFPPVEVCYDGQDYWLWDGFHRVAACRAAGLDELDAHVTQGTQADAQWLSYGANKTHGLYRKNEDKQRAVQSALSHPRAAGLSNVQLAEHCGVDETMIRRYRAKFESTSVLPKSTRRTGRDGRTINTNKIGKPDTKTDTAMGTTLIAKTDTATPARTDTAVPAGRAASQTGRTTPSVERPASRATVAADAFKPVLGHSTPTPMVPLSLPRENPRIAAGTLVELFDRAWLTALVEQINAHLQEHSL